MKEYYTYDANRNLTGAESRTYEYDVENRLIEVWEGSSQIRAFMYDGDGGLRTVSENGTVKTRYAAPDYQVNVSDGEPTVYYRLGGRTVAWRNSRVVRYLLTDHLGSSHGETSETRTDSAQRRCYPFGSDRAVSGASDLSRDERFTGQKRIDAGGGSARRELYHYGVRWYLRGRGITQPDSIVPDPGNPRP